MAGAVRVSCYGEDGERLSRCCIVEADHSARMQLMSSGWIC